MDKPAISTRLDRPVILHLSADYPDSFRNRTTLAVRNLIAASPDFEHVVVSLKRQASPWSTYLRNDPQVSVGRVFAFGYWGLPLGIGHFVSMALVARRIQALLAQEQIAPQIIHAHKLCFEGIVAWLLARRLGLPFVTSLRGEAETKIIRFKPSYRPLIKQVARDARIVFAVSMWFVPELKRTVPCIEERDPTVAKSGALHPFQKRDARARRTPVCVGSRPQRVSQEGFPLAHFRIGACCEEAPRRDFGRVRMEQ